MDFKKMSIYTILIAGAFVMFNFFSTFIGPGNSMSPQEYIEVRIGNPGVLIDVRTPGEHKMGHLKGTDHNFDLNSGEFQKIMPKLDKEKTYYLYCRSGNRSGQAARMMKASGFENVYNIGGFQTLVRAGLEAAKK
jgi:phage shock protein E